MTIQIQITVPGLMEAIRPPQQMLSVLGYTMAVWPDAGDWELAAGDVLVWHGGPEIAAEADLLALWQGPTWVAHRKRALIEAAAEAIGAPMDALWARWDRIRFAAPARLSAANQARHGADLDTLSAAIAAAEMAINGYATIQAVEAVGAAIVPPDYVGPEDIG